MVGAILDSIIMLYIPLHRRCFTIIIAAITTTVAIAVIAIVVAIIAIIKLDSFMSLSLRK